MNDEATAQRLTIKQEGITWTPTDDGSIVILNLETSMYLSVNTSATVLWDLLLDGTSQQRLISEIVEHYDISIDAATQDVEAFLVGLAESGLLERSRGQLLSE